MSTSTASPAPEAQPSRFGPFWPPLLIALAAVAAYRNSFSGPFVFDDIDSILENPTIRHLWPIGTVLSPTSGGLTVSGRPLVNLTLALNYAMGGTRVWGYHAVNLLIHVLAGLTLYGAARRTLLRRGALQATLASFAIALIWTLHPLQTESVTYIIQRAESLMGLFYLQTIYCFIRAATDEGASACATGRAPSDKEAGGNLWLWLSIFCCLLGMASKEVMVSAPVMVLLYDRTFVAGSFRKAWRRRRPYYLGLASTWLFLGCLVLGGGFGRGGSAGFGAGISWWVYSLTQFEAIVRYLQLALWPHPLVFEYGTFWVTSAARVVPYACVVAPLVAATLVALRRWPAWGFLGFWFFAVLAPTSLVPGTTQMIVEHRMYLALAPLTAAIVYGGCALIERTGVGKADSAPIPTGGWWPARAWLGLLIVFAGTCGAVTFLRNEDYRSEVALWADTVAKRPENALARSNLGLALETMPGRLGDAVAQLQGALRIEPDFAEAHNNLGVAWLGMPGRLNDAIAQFEEALRLKPDYAEAHDNLGKAWAKTPGGSNDAIAQFEEALRLRPGFAEAHNNLGNLWSNLPGKLTDAVTQFEEAIRLEPDYAEAHNNLGDIWSKLPGRLTDAIDQFKEAIRLKPDFAEAHNNLGIAWSNVPGRSDDAIAEYRQALRLKPDYAEAHNNLGDALAAVPGRLNDAIAEYREALRLWPDYAEAHYDLGCALAALPGRLDDAIAEYREALRLNPDLAEAHYNLGCLLANMPDRLDDAIAQFEDAVRLNPDYAEAHFNLAIALLHVPGRGGEAEAQLDSVLRLRPDDDRARQILALLKVQQ